MLKRRTSALLPITIVYTQVYKLNYEETVNNTTNIEELHINVQRLCVSAVIELLTFNI